jgi:hypothetical protein
MTPRNRRDHSPFFICPHCGVAVRAGAVFCPSCGASDESGWADGDEDYGDLGDGDEDEEFDYQDFVRREFPDQAEPGARGFRRLLVAAIVLLLIASLILLCSF